MLDLHTLNPQQLEAVKQTEGALLVLAGAGSGKTRVITYRIAYLILYKKVHPENILAVTFTNKAANEMKERVHVLVGKDRSEGVIVSTFHSLCVRVLRREIEHLGYKRNFSIYSSSDQLGLVRQIVRDLDLDGKKYDAEAILWKISAAKNRLIGPRDYAQDPEAAVVDPLDGIAFQRKWESRAYELGGGGYLAPAQLVGDFIKRQRSSVLGSVLPSYQPGVNLTDLAQPGHGCLPDDVLDAIRLALPAFERQIRGFTMPDAVLTGVETRTSSRPYSLALSNTYFSTAW